MTDRLYYTDSYSHTFTASVTRAFEHQGRPAVSLDRTAFYPTSGGQPADAGMLGGVVVADVIDEEDIVHVIASPLVVGSPVMGEIDWTRRFDHMQQHTGQHLLSAAFDRLFENATVGFHMGADVVTIDLAREAPVADIERAVDDANRVVWEDRPVTVRFASSEAAAALGLRKEPTRAGEIRLIDIDGYDVCACGGTHVSRTGAIGVIAALGWERQRAGTRVTFVCGARALKVLRTYRDAVASSIRMLSVLPAELPGAVERVQNESKALNKQIDELNTELAGYQGARLLAEAPEAAGVRVVVHEADRADMAQLKRLAAAACAAGRACAVVLSKSSPVSLAVACSAGVPVDAAAVLRRVIDRFGGKGGGRPQLAQGGGLAASSPEVASAALEIVQTFLQPAGS
jgi:alanyl-tRNA synthetase